MGWKRAARKNRISNLEFQIPKEQKDGAQGQSPCARRAENVRQAQNLEAVTRAVQRGVPPCKVMLRNGDGEGVDVRAAAVDLH